MRDLTYTHGPISLRQAFRFAWRTLMQRFGLFAVVLLTFIAAWVALEVVVIRGQQFGIVLWVVAHVAFLIFFAGLEAGLTRICLDLYDGGAPTLAALFARLATGPKLLAGQVIYLLVLVVGLALLIVPGAYLGARFALFSFRLVDGEANVIGSFRQSAAMSAGTMPQLLAILASLLVLNVLGACVLGLGLFVTVPLSVLTMAAIYRQLAAPERARAEKIGRVGQKSITNEPSEI